MYCQNLRVNFCLASWQPVLIKLFGCLSSLKAVQVLSLIKVLSAGSSIPTEGPGGFPRRDTLLALFPHARVIGALPV